MVVPGEAEQVSKDGRRHFTKIFDLCAQILRHVRIQVDLRHVILV